MLYMDDARMRSEEFERLLRKTHLADAASRAAGGPGVPRFVATTPWGYIFQQPIHSENSDTTAFWATQVKYKALLHQCRLRGESELTSDGTVAPYARSAASALALHPSQKGRKRARDPLTTSGKGNDNHCWNFNSGRCTDPCLSRRIDTCAFCNKPHPVIRCWNAPADIKTRGQGQTSSGSASTGGGPKGKGQGATKGKAKQS